MSRKRCIVPLLALVAALLAPAGSALAAEQHVAYYENIWSRTDLPVADGMVNRTWMWGPEPFTAGFRETYVGAPGQSRLVQYYDKSRMEITDPRSDLEIDLWYVTNGLLTTELITGRLQLGDDTFEQYDPADVNVAGDADDAFGPTYASFTGLLNVPLGLPDELVTARVDRDGDVEDDSLLAGYGVTSQQYVIETNHRVASVFWEFMNSSGLVADYSLLGLPTEYSNDVLFQNPYYATGYPITEAYWAEVKVADVYQDVLIQCFERRCLTYTPDNPEGWKVEAGNVGRHYYAWRYGTDGPGSIEPPNVRISDIWADEVDDNNWDDEYVTITNADDVAVDLEDWWIVDENLEVLVHFIGVTLEPGESITIYSCDGDDPNAIYTGSCDSWWDWSDAASLYSSDDVLVDFYWYSSQ